MNEIGIDIEQANRIQYIKQLSYAEIKEERRKVQRQKIDNELVELANRVALRISDYINGEPYNPNYDLSDANAVFHVDVIQKYLNSVFDVKFVVRATTYSSIVDITTVSDDAFRKIQAQKWQKVIDDSKVFL